MMVTPDRSSQAGSHARFDAMYRAHHCEVLAYFIRRIPRSDAEDAAAEVFTVAWRRFDQVPEGAEAVAWLFGVARKVLANHRRSLRRTLRLSRRVGGLASPVSSTPELQVVRSEEDEALLRALEKLRLADREILKLATWEKLPHRAIGDLLGLTEAAVGQRISRARKRLAAELARSEKQHRISVPLLRRKEG